MSIKEIKDVKKLQQMLKSEMCLRVYVQEQCQHAGEELAKYTFEWDNKESTLVLQAMELNKNYEKLKLENDKLREQLMQKSEVDMFFNTPLEGWSSNPCSVCRYRGILNEVKESLQVITETNKIYPLQTNLEKIVQIICGAENENQGYTNDY